MKKSIGMSKFYLLILLVAGMISCQEKNEVVLFEPSSVSFDPALDNFKGSPGDILNMNVIVEGESSFVNFKKIKLVGGQMEEESFLLETMDEQYPVPYHYEFSYVLKEDEIGKAITFSFRIESEISDPQRGRMTIMGLEDLKIITVAP
ncbi:BAR domain-containing protein [Anditalea andensis]|nr:hypothetical protein [Anditalea andensis]